MFFNARILQSKFDKIGLVVNDRPRQQLVTWVTEAWFGTDIHKSSNLSLFFFWMEIWKILWCYTYWGPKCHLFSLWLGHGSVAVGAPLLLARSRTNLLPEKIPLLPRNIIERTWNAKQLCVSSDWLWLKQSTMLWYDT